MGLAVLIALVAVAFAAGWAMGPWSLPAAISESAAGYDSHLQLTLLVLGAAFLAVQLLLTWAIWRFRSAPLTTRPEGLRWDYLGGGISAVVFFGLGLAGLSMDRALPQDAAAVKAEVLAQQFAWNFRHPGPDGVFGRNDPKLVNDALANPFGLVREDPAGRDDLVRFTLKVPVNTTVELRLHARDVIHSLFIRELRLKQDLIPGMSIPVRFRAEKTGTYEIACTELCGLGHHQMKSLLEVVSREEYERWVQTGQ